jgi:hypothetical protein
MRYSRGQAEDLGRHSHPASLTLVRELLPVVIAHDKAGGLFLDGPRGREAASGHFKTQ